MIKDSRPRKPVRASSALDAWERGWQNHWSEVGLPGYELPVGGPVREDREFLSPGGSVCRRKI